MLLLLSCHINFRAIRKCSRIINGGIYIPFYLLLILWNSVYKVTTHALVKTETWNLGTWVNDHTDRQPQGQSLQSGKSTTFPHQFSFLKNIQTQISGLNILRPTNMYLSATVLTNKLKIFPCF